MSNSKRVTLIIIASAILIGILITVVLFDQINKSKRLNQGSTLTSGEQIGPTLSNEEVKKLEKEVEEINTDVLTLEQAEKLDVFITKLPYISPDFELGYSNFLGQFFIYNKTSQADTKLKDYLVSNNFLDVYDEYPSLFVITEQPVSQAILQAEKEISEQKTKFQEQK